MIKVIVPAALLFVVIYGGFMNDIPEAYEGYQVGVLNGSHIIWIILGVTLILSFVFQAINLVPHLTLLDNVSFPGYLIRGDRRAVYERARELLCCVGLEDQVVRLPGKVSGGEQQRAAIARALINSPKVLFADEPTGNLNSAQGRNVLEILTSLNADGQSILMVTHDIKAAARAGRLLFLADGKIGGDLSLGLFTERSGVERERQVFAYLTERGW